MMSQLKKGDWVFIQLPSMSDLRYWSKTTYQNANKQSGIIMSFNAYKNKAFVKIKTGIIDNPIPTAYLVRLSKEQIINLKQNELLNTIHRLEYRQSFYQERLGKRGLSNWHKIYKNYKLPSHAKP